MTKREVVHCLLEHKRPPYVPWHFGFTVEAKQKLLNHFGSSDLMKVTDNHFLMLGEEIGYFQEIGNNRFRDIFGVIWDRSIDRDIGNVEGQVLTAPELKGYTFPDPVAERYFSNIPVLVKKYPDRFRIFEIGFSLFERAWTLRGMEALLMDFIISPDFVHDLMNAICEYNIKQIRRALEFEIDAVKLGDDWGQQRGLIMGPVFWQEFIKPYLSRIFSLIKDAGKYVFIHSCGDVDELFDPLIHMGMDNFNPFQPEVMDIYGLLASYRGRLTFHGGLSTQRILPFGSPDEVRFECDRLLSAGADGGYIFAPSHDVEGDVPLENMLIFIEKAKNQPGYKEQFYATSNY
jgi:uroporphyrinogen decarboxylase